MESIKSKKIIIIVASIVVVALLATFGFYMASGATDEKQPAAKPAVAKAGKEFAGCTTADGPVTDLSRFIIPAMNQDTDIEPVGNDKTGAPGAPIIDPTFGAAWYKHSPKIGSDQGKVIINIHNSPLVDTLGGEMLKHLKPGDLIKIKTKSGKVVCYRYTHKIHFLVKDYDPNSDIYYDEGGKPQLAIMTCSEMDPKSIHADGSLDAAGRYIFYADYIPPSGIEIKDKKAAGNNSNSKTAKDEKTSK